MIFSVLQKAAIQDTDPISFSKGQIRFPLIYRRQYGSKISLRMLIIAGFSTERVWFLCCAQLIFNVCKDCCN